jgi:hypothetical protein
MKRSYVLVVMAMMCLFVMGRTAGAQDPESVIVSVPFDFVAGARTMAAGTYKVERVSFDAHGGLIIGSRENSALVLPIAVDDASGVQTASLKFERVGDEYILAKVETPDRVYTIAIPPAKTMLVQVKDHKDAVTGTK